MRNILAVLVLTTLGSTAQADTTLFEEMYRNSFVSYCDGRYCTDTDTGQRYEVEGPPVAPGYLLNFSQPYTDDQIAMARTYILDRYANEEPHD